MRVGDASLLSPEFQIIESVITIFTTKTEVVKGNSRRIALIFSVDDSADSYLISTLPDSAADQGMLISATNSPYAIEWGKYPSLPGQTWYASNPAGPIDATVIEVLERPSATKP